ncbi:hypothetical protein C0991_003793 [Blastosporella zonata]|nr:hypothetical protein C0991_003793 [Blastosporella zonata]
MTLTAPPLYRPDLEETKLGEGTFYQTQLGLKPTRKHFFAPIDSTYAEAVNRDAETVEYTDEEEKKVKRKIDRTVLPLVICRYSFNFPV